MKDKRLLDIRQETKNFATLLPKLRDYESKTFVSLCVFFVFLCAITTVAQVTTKADTTKIRIGEQFNYQIEVATTTGVEFFKLRLDSLQKIEVIKEHKVDTLKDKLIKKFTLTSFDSGRYMLPKQLVKIFSKPIFTDSLIVDVSTVAIDTIKQPLFPIKAIQQQELNLKDYAKNYWWLLILVPIIGFVVWWFFIRKKETEEEKIAKIPPFQLAINQLVSLDKKLLWQNNKTKQYYSELTDIIRTYIEKELKVPALESTTNELVNALKKVNNVNKLDISKKTLLKLKDLLQEADLVKFAKSKPFADEIEMHRKYADIVLEGLKPDETINIPENPELIHVESGLIQNTTAVLNQETDLKKEVDTRVKISKKKKRNIIIISIIALFLISGIYFGKKVYDGVMGKIGGYLDTKSTEKLFNDTWQIQNFDDNTLRLELPIIIEEKELLKLPPRIQKMVVSMKSHEYISLINQLQITLLYFNYVKEVQVDIDQAVALGNASLKNKPGVTGFEHQIEEFSKNNIDGRRIFGTYTDNGIIRDFQIFVFVKNNRMWMISLAHKPNDEFGEKIIERIINSINLENAN